jgi:hypothetical protein
MTSEFQPPYVPLQQLDTSLKTTGFALLSAASVAGWLPASTDEADDGEPAAPEGLWFDFDPTNNRSGQGSPGEEYVTLATGRDFSDVSPMRGVIQGGARHALHVGVTVAPPEEFGALQGA